MSPTEKAPEESSCLWFLTIRNWNPQLDAWKIGCEDDRWLMETGSNPTAEGLNFCPCCGKKLVWEE